MFTTGDSLNSGNIYSEWEPSEIGVWDSVLKVSAATKQAEQSLCAFATLLFVYF